MNSRYPFNLDGRIDNDTIYGILFVYQFSVAMFCGLVVCSVDNMVFSSLIFIKYQMQLLGYRLSNCGNTASSTSASYNEKLTECIKMHIDIKE